MASVSPDQLTKEQKDELCVSYAALMLHDDGLEINVSTASNSNAQTEANQYLYVCRQRN